MGLLSSCPLPVGGETHAEAEPLGPAWGSTTFANGPLSSGEVPSSIFMNCCAFLIRNVHLLQGREAVYTSWTSPGRGKKLLLKELRSSSPDC